MRQHVFIIGSKGIPAHYGGFESFVDRLTYYNITYPVLQIRINGINQKKYLNIMVQGVFALKKLK